MMVWLYRSIMSIGLRVMFSRYYLLCTVVRADGSKYLGRKLQTVVS